MQLELPECNQLCLVESPSSFSEQSYFLLTCTVQSGRYYPNINLQLTEVVHFSDSAAHKMPVKCRSILDYVNGEGKLGLTARRLACRAEWLAGLLANTI